MFGHTPAFEWTPNPDGSVRTIGEAVEIARSHGVFIPDYVAFFVDELDWLDEHTTARGPKVTKPTGGIVLWDDLLNRYGMVPFIVRRDILESDEAIVAVIGHEMYELHGLRPLLNEGRLTIEEFGAHTSPDNPDNLHCEAWDAADRLVEKMRS